MEETTHSDGLEGILSQMRPEANRCTAEMKSNLWSCGGCLVAVFVDYDGTIKPVN